VVDRPLLMALGFDSEDDGQSGYQWTIACFVAWGLGVQGIIADLKDRQGSDGPSLPSSLSKQLGRPQ
ncbi:hypothetical protein HAX54_027623, partial [Datura stramonium]|nr:hypothetical protein [Datura stramonium]